jgi:HAD superfamily hydrolase (TIGR01509 family)
MTESTFDWLVVDLGGVVAHFRPDRRLFALSRLTGLPEDVVHQRLFTSGFDHDAEVGRFDTDTIVDAIEKQLDCRIASTDLIDAWSMAFEPNLELLELLSAQPWPRALFTNNGPMLDLCIRGPLAVLATHVDRVICSWHLQATKPNVDSFARAAERLGAPPARLVLLDDSTINAETAVASGWHSITFATIDGVCVGLQALEDAAVEARSTVQVSGPFDWILRANGDVVITHHRRVATTLRGRRAEQFIDDVAAGDAQAVMARATGNYRRGNERQARNHPRNRR